MSADKVIRGTIPDSEAKDIPYRCFCGFRGTYAEREAHHATHKGKKP